MDTPQQIDTRIQQCPIQQSIHIVLELKTKLPFYITSDNSSCMLLKVKMLWWREIPRYASYTNF